MFRITTPGIKGQYYARLAAFIAAWIDRLTVQFDSDSETESYAWLGTPSGLSELKGEKRLEGLRENFLQIRNRVYQGGHHIAREIIERDKSGGQVMGMIDEFAVRCGEHWTELLSELIALADGTTLGKCSDGKAFFAADHAEGKSGVQRNLFTADQIDELAVVKASKPTAAEGVDAILAVIAQILNVKDDQGRKMNANARQFMVMTGPILWMRLVKAIVNPVIEQSQTNTIVSLQRDGFNVDIVANPHLDWTVDFSVFRTDSPLKPFIRQKEIPKGDIEVELDVFGPETEYYRLNDEIFVKAYSRRGVGYGRWQYAAKATLSNAEEEE
jgi:phage major head subunit gpT-like protein